MMRKSIPLIAVLCAIATGAAAQTSPINGTWFNSYCSRVDLTAQNGMITGVYTSHTGSTGSSTVVGQYDETATPSPSGGLPFSMGIQWRLINVNQSQADGSWHWVSSFSGQYHPSQTISEPNQNPYQIPETLEILNGLLATATVTGLADTAPIFWPQTLDFTRTPPSYCNVASPPTPVAYTPTASDMVTGVWTKPDGSTLILNAALQTGEISGTYLDPSGTNYAVYGLFDTLAPSGTPNSTVHSQGLTLTLGETGIISPREVKMFTGGVIYATPTQMYLWESNLQSTTWTDRFTQEDLDKAVWTKN